MRLKIFILLCAACSGAGTLARAEGKAHSTSTSRQFIVYGADVPVRGAMCDLAERSKANLLHVLDLPDDWKTPLVINLDFPQVNLPEALPSRLDFSQIGSGLKLQLNLLLTSDFNGPDVQRDLLRAILIEMMYRERTNVAAGTHYAAPPDWLIDGLLQLAPGHDAERATELLETMVQSNHIAPIDEVVWQKRELLEPASRQVHDAYSMALVQLLLDEPNGRKKLRQFLQDLPDAPNDAVADLRAHFPDVLGRSSSKWWNLSVARLSAKERYRTLSADETAKRLDQALRINVRGKDGKPHGYEIDDLASYRDLAGSRVALLHASQELLLLSARAHPIYHLIVQDYYQVATQLARGQVKESRHRLTRLASYRAFIESEGRDVDDYLNWFEATQLKTMSGAFSEILKSASEENPAPPRRRDPISVYLDAIESTL